MQNSMVMLTFSFKLQTPLLSKFGQKNQNYQFKLKFGKQTSPRMQNLMVVFAFSVFNRKYPFLGKFGQKNLNCQFKLKFGTWTNSNVQSSVVMFTYSDFDQMYIYCVGKFGPKFHNCLK